MTRRGLIAVSAAALLAACSRLALFNRLTPKDPGGRLAADGVAYGPDPRQRLDVYVPVKPAAGPAPVAVFFYGGNWDSGERALYSWVGRALASRGFVTVIPDYRLVPAHPFPDFVDDGAAAVAKARAIVQQYGGDPDRVALVGHSAGAYIAVLLALDPRYLERAGVEMRDIRAVVGLAGPYDFYPFDVPASVAAVGQFPDPQQTQPIHFARGDAPPLFLGHGDKDTTVALRHSTALYAAINKLGGDVELKIYKGADHVSLILPLSRPFRGRRPLLDDVTSFLRTKL
ncbi:MAG TPA: alpha/beta hydrolase [Caulobacteraceae bacterium]|jgi:acetyl esterase/lipase